MKEQLLVILLFSAIVFLGCKYSASIHETTKVSIESVKSKDSKGLVNDLLIQLDNNSNRTSQTLRNFQDCIFDQTTQTDFFLVNIEALKGYVWDSKTKVASVVLDKDWSLEIKRGGCDHYEFAATFKTKRKLDIKKDEDVIFNKVIWITSLLNEFDGETIRNALMNNKVEIVKQDESNFYGNFMVNELYELYYFNFNTTDKGTTFNIGYYFN